MAFVDECRMLPGFKSDHSFGDLEFTWDEVKTGPGLRKFNSLHLDRPDILEKMT